jgi:WD40 repeat protein
MPPSPCRLRIYDTPQEVLDIVTSSGRAHASDHGSASATAVHPPIPPAQLQGDSFPPALRLHEGELIYDYTWFPGMIVSDPASCCFATASRGRPIHLWDACSGELRCSYRLYDAADEPTAAYCIAFSPDGSQLWAGERHAINIFDVSRPGRDYRTLVTHKKGREGQPGIISCMAFQPYGSGMMAAGSYGGAAALYDSNTMDMICVLEGHAGGITQASPMHAPCVWGHMNPCDCIRPLSALCLCGKINQKLPMPVDARNGIPCAMFRLPLLLLPAGPIFGRWQLSVHGGSQGQRAHVLGRAALLGGCVHNGACEREYKPADSV